MGVSENRGTPKSSILIGISIIFTIHFGVLLFLETPILTKPEAWRVGILKGIPFIKTISFSVTSAEKVAIIMPRIIKLSLSNAIFTHQLPRLIVSRFRTSTFPSVLLAAS